MPNQPPTAPSSLSGLASQDVVARGYWMPTGRANFFRHSNDQLLAPPVPEFRLDEVVSRGQERDDKGGIRSERLQSSVYRRLAEVLNTKGYKWIIPLVPRWRRIDYPEQSDPDTVLLICEDVAAAVTPVADQAAQAMKARLERLYMQKQEVTGTDSSNETAAVDQRATQLKEITHAIAVCEADQRHFADNWKALTDHLRALVLAVRSDGFFLWIGVPNGDVDITQEPTFLNMQRALRTYLYWIVGGDYFSHFAGSGRPGEDGPSTEYEKKPSLNDYRKDHLGILNFFQINTILEGLYNATFDPIVFFDDGRDDYRVEMARRKYSLGGFVRLISSEALISTEPQRPPADGTQRPDLMPDPAAPGRYRYARTLTQEIDALLELLHKWRDERSALPRPAGEAASVDAAATEDRTTSALLDTAERVCKRSLDDVARRDLLRQFLRTTATESLQEMKWRIERCRRALLSEVLEITHRREPILQVEVPEQDDVIDNVSESQLRGYIMLLAAKLPLVSNVRLFLDDAYDLLSRTSLPAPAGAAPPAPTPDPAASDSAPESAPPAADKATPNANPAPAPYDGTKARGTPPDSPKGQIRALYHTWQAYIIGVSSNIKGLERAIEQARMDRMVSEEERIRSEQETIAEIQRLSENTSTSLPQDRTLVVSIIANLIALISVSLTALGFIANSLSGVIPSKPISWDQIIGPFVKWPDGLYLAGRVLLILAAAILAYAILDKGIYWFAHVMSSGFGRLFGSDAHKDERYYYEMDINLDVPIDGKKALAMFGARFEPNYETRERWMAGLWNGLADRVDKRDRAEAKASAEGKDSTDKSDKEESAERIGPVLWFRRWVYRAWYGLYSGAYARRKKRFETQLSRLADRLARATRGKDALNRRRVRVEERRRTVLARLQARLERKFDGAPRSYRWIPMPRERDMPPPEDTKTAQGPDQGGHADQRAGDPPHTPPAPGDRSSGNGESSARLSSDSGAEPEPYVALAGFSTPERHSYRAERMDADEALHKVYFGTILRWRRGWRWWRLWRYDLMSLVLVYEILYHVPSSQNRYVFQDLRVVATYRRTLTSSQILELKQLVAQSFINPWVSDPKRKIKLYAVAGGSQRVDALLTLNILSEEPRSSS